ncbi:MAG: YafY family transcriptional regulator [Deltaproteobacteria bacterium]|nr:YafY family transcriptional regulator [Deltaproteobacteria bacterium]
MRRADRLFQIIQILRGRRLTTARVLSEKLEVSERTIYRDVNDLVCSGVPIRGEAGIGYVLEKGFDLPPLMFTREEIEALALGARIVRSWADPYLAGAAEQALSKIEVVLPPELKGRVEKMPLFAVNFTPNPQVAERLAQLRSAIREKRKVELDYSSADGAVSIRTVRPLCLTFFAPNWMLTAWCELRNAFRNFRLDRLNKIAILDEIYKDEPGKSLEDFLAEVTGK